MIVISCVKITWKHKNLFRIENYVFYCTLGLSYTKYYILKAIPYIQIHSNFNFKSILNYSIFGYQAVRKYDALFFEWNATSIGRSWYLSKETWIIMKNNLSRWRFRNRVCKKKTSPDASFWATQFESFWNSHLRFTAAWSTVWRRRAVRWSWYETKMIVLRSLGGDPCGPSLDSLFYKNYRENHSHS